MRDSQRRAVYRWEMKIGAMYNSLDNQMALEDCKRLVNKVWSDYYPERFSPSVIKGREGCSATGSRSVISLPTWAMNPRVVLHETAHSLLPWYEKHGRIFTSTYLDLLVRYFKINRSIARKLGMNQYPRRVWFAPINKCPKPKKKIYKF